MDERNLALDAVTQRRIGTLAFFAVAVVAFVVFYLTCFRTITWWDSLNYTIAAHCLGVPAPPGSLLAVIVGWLVTLFVPPTLEAFALNLLAGLLGALTAALMFAVGWRLLGWDPTGIRLSGSTTRQISTAALLGGGALILAFGDTLWLHATKFTPYIFTAFLTSVILLLLLRWWQKADEPMAWHTLVFIAFLLGLDFSIHRTNLLLIPGVLLCVLLRWPAGFPKLRAGELAIEAFVIGLAVHLIQIPLASREPFMNFNDPSTFGRFWDYISLKQYGGGWLLSIFPRKAPFWSYQVADYLKVFRVNFFSWSGKIGVLGLLPGLFGAIGLGVLFWKSWRLALALVGLFLCAAGGAIIYFNIPSDFFRPFDRHYLPSLVIFSVFILYGLGVTAVALRQLIKKPAFATGLILALAVGLPLLQLARNYHARDASRNRFAYDFGANLMATLPPNAILFTYGDTDTYPAWYLQAVEGQRPDVTVINVPLLNTSWYVEQILSRDSSLALAMTPKEIRNLAPRTWADTVVKIGVGREKTASQASFRIPPTIEGKYLLAQDWVILQIIANNKFIRPIYFSTGSGGNNPSWAREHLALEGLAYRLAPETKPPMNLSLLAGNVFDKYHYAGFNDPTVAIEDASISQAQNYWSIFAQYAMAAGNDPAYTEYAKRRTQFLQVMPPARFMPASGNLAQLLQAIESGKM